MEKVRVSSSVSHADIGLRQVRPGVTDLLDAFGRLILNNSY